MEKMQNLQDLLKHEIEDLYSAEDQITVALPKMIEKAKNGKLKQALTQHLKVTEEQIRRLDRIQELLNAGGNGEEGGERKGILGGLFGGGTKTCKGMQGIITEGEKIMGEDMDPDVMDAAIIASAQKVEHYEICSYGTARAYARELRLTEVERLLTQTLNEEYESDDLLTGLAVMGGLNEEALDRSKRRASNGQGNSGGGRSKSASKSSGSSKGGSRSSGGSKSATKSSRGGSSKGASKSSGRGGSKAASKSSRGGASKSSGRGGSKAASKSSGRGGNSKGASKSSGRGGSSKGASKGGGRSKAASNGGRKSASKSRR